MPVETSRCRLSSLPPERTLVEWAPNSTLHLRHIVRAGIAPSAVLRASMTMEKLRRVAGAHMQPALWSGSLFVADAHSFHAGTTARPNLCRAENCISRRNAERPLTSSCYEFFQARRQLGQRACDDQRSVSGSRTRSVRKSWKSALEREGGLEACLDGSMSR